MTGSRRREWGLRLDWAHHGCFVVLLSSRVCFLRAVAGFVEGLEGLSPGFLGDIITLGLQFLVCFPEFLGVPVRKSTKIFFCPSLPLALLAADERFV